MRVLVTHHAPLDGCASGRYVVELAQALANAGHEVRGLIVGPVRDGSEPFSVRRVVCSANDRSADLPFDVPYFGSEPLGTQTFEALSDLELANYREAFRRLLDREVAEFDPHVIHAQHVWVQAQLALESGVTYVVSAWGPELESYTADPRYRWLADQAAENAGKILIADEALRGQLAQRFEGVADRVVAMPRVSAVDLNKLYAATFEQRFGRLP